MSIEVSLYDVSVDGVEIEAVKQVLQSKWISMGPVTEKFEQEFSEKLGMKTPSVAVNSGTAALHTALHALGIQKGDEVLVPSITFVATAASVIMAGAVPVFVDSKSIDDFSMSPEDMKKKITSKTKAVIVVHYGGFSADMNNIMEYAKYHKLKVIEDVAHGPTLFNEEKALGTIGDAGCFSFLSTKNITSAEGGMVVSQHKEVLEKAKLFRSHYMNKTAFQKHESVSAEYDITNVGYNYRMNDILAAIGLVQLKKYDEHQEKRKKGAALYRELFSSSKSNSCVKVPYTNFSVEKSAHHLFPIILKNDNRSEIMQLLRDQGIQTTVHYPPCHLFTYYQKNFHAKVGDCPVAEQIGRTELSLPIHPNLTEQQIKTVSEKVIKIAGGYTSAHRV